uniref:hypothetical protein n=1 Tax=uncultured Allobacillus sp. TaxID=1638025 RepID=UPI0025981ACF|nr:hypothetical protein [uncultured Allobacillus sp.]
MFIVLGWLLLLLGAFLLNLLGMMELLPRLITFPLLFTVIFIFIFTITQKNSIRRR